jgi:hypothetical protein
MCYQEAIVVGVLWQQERKCYGDELLWGLLRSDDLGLHHSQYSCHSHMVFEDVVQ